ncbi:DUF2971 domain-containing protein [Wenyingzhuangia sp. IMCC45574]
MGRLGEDIPNVVYHYTSLEVGIEKILKKNTLKISKANSLNDPFEFDLRLIEVDLDKFIEERPVLKNLSQVNRELLKKEPNRKNIQEKSHQDINDSFKGILDENFIACFSERKSNILMWSHYGLKHTGVCIGFSTKDNMKSFLRVDYEIEFKPLKLSFSEKGDSLKIIEKLAGTKSIDWEYEKEIRFLNFKHPEKEILSFNPKMVKEIYFGMKIPIEKIENKIKELQLYGYNEVKYYQMEKVPNEFKLRKKPINI